MGPAEFLISFKAVLSDLISMIDSVAPENKECDVLSLSLAQAWVGGQFDAHLSRLLPTFTLPERC